MDKVRIKTERELVRIQIDDGNAFWNEIEFWNTATAKTLDNGEIELTATIDGKVKIVTEASVSRHLQLADYDGISSLPTTEIFPRSPTQTPVADEAASIGVDVRYRGATTTVTGLEA
ncbi:hypothetical protein Tco_1404642 [Tanacetum coccineum]